MSSAQCVLSAVYWYGLPVLVKEDLCSMVSGVVLSQETYLLACLAHREGCTAGEFEGLVQVRAAA